MAGKVEILLVDDEPIVCRRLKPALEKSGYSVEVSNDGTDALRRLEEKQFDVLITDVRMPGMDGIRMLGEVRKKSPTLKVIVITGYATIEMAREVIAKGAFDFVAKPFKPDELRKAVQRAIDTPGRELQEENT